MYDYCVKVIQNYKMNTIEIRTKKQIYISLLLACILWILTFPNLNIAFTSITHAVIGVKIIQLPLLFIAMYKCLDLHRKINNKDVKLSVILYFFLYFSLMLLFCVLIYPGSWRWDDAILYNQIANGEMKCWQNYLTAFFYIYSIELIPSPFGVILNQIFIISIIVTYLINEAGKFINNKYLKILLFIPFVLPATINTNLWPMRLTIYSYLEILIIFELFLTRLNNKKWNLQKIVFFSFMTAVLSVWRTEGFYYALAIPVLFLIMFWKQIDRKQKLLLPILTFCFTVIIYIPQYDGSKKEFGLNYELTAYIGPIVPLVHQSVVENNVDVLKNIDRVFDVSIIEKGHLDGKIGEYMYFHQQEYPLIRSHFSNEDYDVFKKTYIKMITRHFDTFIIDRLKNVYVSADDSWDPRTSTLYTNDDENIRYFRSNYILNSPINLKIREVVVRFLEADGGWRRIRLGYNFIPQIFTIIILSLFILIKARKYFLLIASYDLRLILTIITAPTCWFMYYYSAYLAGNIILVTLLCYIIDKKMVKYES